MATMHTTYSTPEEIRNEITVALSFVDRELDKFNGQNSSAALQWLNLKSNLLKTLGAHDRHQELMGNAVAEQQRVNNLYEAALRSVGNGEAPNP